jgi:hypothetical protein
MGVSRMTRSTTAMMMATAIRSSPDLLKHEDIVVAVGAAEGDEFWYNGADSEDSKAWPAEVTADGGGRITSAGGRVNVISHIQRLVRQYDLDMMRRKLPPVTLPGTQMSHHARYIHRTKPTVIDLESNRNTTKHIYAHWTPRSIKPETHSTHIGQTY